MEFGDLSKHRIQLKKNFIPTINMRTSPKN